MRNFFIILGTLFVLVACGNDADDVYKDQLEQAQKDLDEAEAETKRLEEISDQIDETSDLIAEVQEEMGIEDDSNDKELDESEVRDLLEYGALSEDDSLTNLVVENGEIKAIVEIGDNEIFDDKSLLAETVYSMAGDELLQHEGWEVLTIEFVDIGDVLLHRDEKESNEYGDYFPLEKIIGQLE